MLTFARVVQGLLAGVLQSLTMFTLFSVFPPHQRGLAMGFFSINVIFGPAVGPTIGGILIEHFNWRAVFYMALPFSVIGILFGTLLMPQREETAKRADFDWLGFALLCMTMSSLLTGLSNGQREGWSSDFIVQCWHWPLSRESHFLSGSCASRTRWSIFACWRSARLPRRPAWQLFSESGSSARPFSYRCSCRRSRD